MTAELQELVTGKKVKVFVLACGLRLIGEIIDEDQDFIQLKNPLEIISEFDEMGQLESFLHPLSPGNISEDMTVNVRAISTWSKASDRLKIEYHNAVMRQVVVDCLKNDYDQEALDILGLSGKKIKKTPPEPLDFDSTTPTEVGLKGYSDSNDAALLAIMKNHPYRKWKLN